MLIKRALSYGFRTINRYKKIKRIAAFISIPRNASQSVLHALGIGPNRDEEFTDSLVIYENHQRGAVLRAKYKLDHLYVFCFTRNPYDRCISWYEFHKNIEPYRSLTFQSWIKQGMPHHWKKQNQTDFAKERMSPLLQYNFVDQCKVDFLGRIDEFDDDLRTIIDKLNSICGEKSLTHRFQYSNMKLNKSQRQYPGIDDYYTDETREMVYSILKKDFTDFRYEK